ncbi:MAG TPA: hypothetical protein VL461_10180 [Dictyobacter sp.]|nr:hypothetical protein [Dictyobacter sp.]
MRLSLAQPVKVRRHSLPGWLRYVLTGMSIILVWQLYVSLSGVSQLLVASPIATVQALITDIGNGQLPSATLVSLQNLGIGMSIGIIVGLALASLSTFSSFGRNLLTVLTAIFSPLPGIAILPLAMLWFGLSPAAIIFVVVFGSVWPISANTETGFRTINAYGCTEPGSQPDQNDTRHFSTRRASTYPVWSTSCLGIWLAYGRWGRNRLWRGWF